MLKTGNTLTNFKAFTSGLAHAGLLSLVVGLAASTVNANEYRISHCLMGCPQGASASNHLLIRPIYTLSYNPDHKSADWVAYRVSADTVGVASSLSREPLDDGYGLDTLTASDFAGAQALGMVRAQYVPLVSFAGTPYWNDVNYLSNAVARTNSLSQGAWYGLDWAVRNLVNRQGEVYVLTGPIYRQGSDALTLPISTSHRVPDGFFKLVANRDGQVAAFRFDQQTSVGVHHCERRTTLEQLQQETGLRFFPRLTDQPAGSLYEALGCAGS
ncbi:MAG: DNA/RNA non-specific endonuclease [Pseudohongiellaceae bacterium]